MTQIMRIDPLSLDTYLRISKAFFRMGRYENAIIYLNDALELEPHNYEALTLLAAVLTEAGNYSEALSVLKKSLNIQYNVETFSMLGYINALEGKKDKAYEIIRHLQSESEYRHAIKLAKIFLVLGEKETTYKFLERAFMHHDPDLYRVKVRSKVVKYKK